MGTCYFLSFLNARKKELFDFFFLFWGTGWIQTLIGIKMKTLDGFKVRFIQMMPISRIILVVLETLRGNQNGVGKREAFSFIFLYIIQE